MPADPLKLAQQVGDQVKQKPLIFCRVGDVLITDEADDSPFAVLGADSTINGITLVSGDAVASASTSALFTVKAWVAGTPTTLATFDTSIAALVKMIAVALSPSNPSLVKGTVLTVAVAKHGGGVLLPPCMIEVDVSPTPPAS